MGSRFGPQGAAISFVLGFLLISGTVSTGCVNRDGEALPAGLMSFPIAIELSVDEDADGNPRFLYVTSSNFGLQYNSGNVNRTKSSHSISPACTSRNGFPVRLRRLRQRMIATGATANVTSQRPIAAR